MDPRNHQALNYSGEKGIENILRKISAQDNYNQETNEGHILSLYSDISKISLEPGGQLEHAGTQHRTIHDLHTEVKNHYNKLLNIADETGVKFINLGIQPLTDIDKIELIPKPRYRIMYPYMNKVGNLGRRMMKQTSSIQISIDYLSEDDSIMKFKTAMGLVPIFSSIFANSPILNGKLTGYKSFRGHVWSDTDRDRCGILKFAFDNNINFESYVNYSFNAGMYFIQRDENLIDMTGITFRRFAETGHKGYSATYEDWVLHITTLFPEVRYKKYLEIRCFDSQPFENMLAAPAMIKGIFYDTDSLIAAWELVKDWEWDDRVIAYDSAHKSALNSKIKGRTFRDLASELIDISKKGLKKHNNLNEDGKDETIYMESMEEDVKNGMCPSDKILIKWDNEWNRDMDKLINYSSYKLSDLEKL